MSGGSRLQPTWEYWIRRFGIIFSRAIWIVQKADSSFLYDKYQNQSIAAHVMRALAAEQSEVSPEQRRAICEAFESANNTQLKRGAVRMPGVMPSLG